ncbi:MAG: alginate lyase family protein [Devosia sp.]
MRAVIAALVMFCAFCSTPAVASVFCVQTELAGAGVDVGGIDGDLGPRTKAAAQAFIAASDFAYLDLPTLSEANAWQWCAAMRRARLGAAGDALPVVNGLSALDFDVTSPPPGAPTLAQRQLFWNLHKTAKRCLPNEDRKYGWGMTFQLPKLTAEDFSEAPDLVFPPATRAAAACNLKFPYVSRGDAPVRSDTPPAPLPTKTGKEIVYINEHYGLTDDSIDIAAFYFVRRLLEHRYNPKGDDATKAIEAMVSWAEANTMSRNIQGEGNGNSGTVHWLYATATADILSAYVDVAPLMTAEQRGIVGPWLNRVMTKIVGNSERYRTHNHHVGWGMMLAIWGLSIGDHDAVQNAIDRYKMAIHDMRPDGSFPAESSRGGEGLTYQSLMTSDLVVMALFFKHSLGIDLFSYAVDGHTVHDAVDFVLASTDNPSVNRKYALPCPQAGDFYGASVNEPHVPTMGPGLTFHDLSYLPSYARLFRERPSHKIIVERWRMPVERAAVHPVMGAAPACMFNTTLENFIRGDTTGIASADTLPTLN